MNIFNAFDALANNPALNKAVEVRQKIAPLLGGAATPGTAPRVNPIDMEKLKSLLGLGKDDDVPQSLLGNEQAFLDFLMQQQHVADVWGDPMDIWGKSTDQIRRY